MFSDPESAELATLRLTMEPVAEIIQHKGASECRYDRLAGLGVLTTDELCDFEQIDSDNLHMLGSVEGEMRSDRGLAVPINQFAPRNLLRNVLKDGLASRPRRAPTPSVLALLAARIHTVPRQAPPKSQAMRVIWDAGMRAIVTCRIILHPTPVVWRWCGRKRTRGMRFLVPSSAGRPMPPPAPARVCGFLLVTTLLIFAHRPTCWTALTH